MSDETRNEAQRPAPPRPTILLACLVRQQGRVRISAREIADLDPRAKLDVRMTDAGEVVLTYRDAEPA